MSILPGIRLVSTWRPSRWITTILSCWRLVRRSRLGKPFILIGVSMPERGAAALCAVYRAPKEYPKDGPRITRAHLCRITHGTCEPVPGAVAQLSWHETPRIVAEVALPWRALGVDGPPAAGQLRMELAATSYHRARWMSWSGLPPAVGLQDTTAWHTVRRADVRESYVS